MGLGVALKSYTSVAKEFKLKVRKRLTFPLVEVTTEKLVGERGGDSRKRNYFEFFTRNCESIVISSKKV